MSPKERDTLPRLSPKERNVLQQLIEGPKYGLELVAGSDGELSRTSVYVLLSRMEDKELIVGKEVPTPPGALGPPRRTYRITGLGQRVLHAHEVALAAWKGAR